MKSGIVALIGRPNVGKSTLLNTLLEEKISIVSNVPQTTRFYLRGIYNDDRGQIVFIDTPGIHLIKDILCRKLNLIAEEAMQEADIVLYLIDLQRRPKEEEALIVSQLKELHVPVIMVLNKRDMGEGHLDSFMSMWADEPEEKKPLYYIPISALTGKNCDELIKALYNNLPKGPPLFPDDVLTDFPKKLAIADIIREKLLLNLSEELPHDCAVFIEKYEEKGNNLAVIYATILVKRDSQKAIVIGKNGSMIKKVGEKARKEIEYVYEKKVYLDLHVSVDAKWTRKDGVLKKLGYLGLE